MITPVVLSGGSGTRLWPLSRKLHPEQFLPLLNQTSSVANRNHVQDVKEIVETLSIENRDEVTLHKRVCRPWGSYPGIDHTDRFLAKRITVDPGAVLSLQLHHHRAEHWVVVNGTAKVTKGEDTFVLSENESTYIPMGTKHRLENIGKIPLEIIEVQTGSYLGEDGIVHFDDIYGREGK